MRFLRERAALVCLFVASLAPATVITLPNITRSRDTVVQRADAAIVQYAKNISALTASTRANRAKACRFSSNIQFSVPSVVLLPGNAPPSRRAQGAGLNLQFDASGPESFQSSYQTLLQSVYTAAQPLMDQLFGPPAVGGTVHVANFDASIGDRQAIAGGYYLPDNGSGVPEIRFPVYNANESAVVNFIHTLLLAYLGPNVYSFDALEEGLVRAVTMKIARTSGALPAGLDQAIIEQTIESSYDIGAFYDWSNQRALGGNPFIAPNLVNEALPATGGSGPYLVRFLMAGSAWAKVLVEYPTFAAQINAAFYSNPLVGSDIPTFAGLGQAIINILNPSNPTVEGLSFPEWLRRQYILETNPTQGNKLLVQATPITSGLTGTDFGVFVIESIYFNRDKTGNENLLSATSYPIYWDNTFARLNTSPQDEIISIIASDGTVGPNFPDENGGQPYAVTVDVPASDQLTRVVVPAGAIATASHTTPNDFYGTVQGVGVQSGDSLVVRATVGSNVFPDIPVTNGAFGATLGSTANYNLYATVDVKLIRTRGGVPTTLFEKVYDKQPGALAISIAVGADTTYSYVSGLPGGIGMVGLPIDPYTSYAPALYGLPANSLLLGRYDSSTGGYHLFPTTEAPSIGHSYFLRLDTAQPSFSIAGRQIPNVTGSVAMKPGWNMIGVPLPNAFAAGTMRVVHAADFPLAYSDATGTELGTDIFTFIPGAPDAASGVPEGGTFVPATTFNPGVGYFVRVLSPEGVSLIFDPPTSQLLSRHRGEQILAQSGNSLRVNVDHMARESYVIAGMKVGGSSVLNLGLDSELPPTVGGFQASIVSSKGHLFRDVRSMAGKQNYTIQVDGLTPGQPATLSFSIVSGVIRSFKVANLATRQVRTMFPNMTWTFTPTSTSQQFLLTLGGR